MATLYNIAAEYRYKLDEIDDESKTPEEVQEIVDSLFETAGNLEEKAENYVRVMRNWQTDIDAIDAEIDRLKARKERRQLSIDRLKDNMKDAMNTMEIDRIETPLGRWTKRAAPWSVTIEDASRVEKRFLIPQPPKIDKKAILEEFKRTGEQLPGCEFNQHEFVMFR